jgi:hypothetical protein
MVSKLVVSNDEPSNHHAVPPFDELRMTPLGYSC